MPCRIFFARKVKLSGSKKEIRTSHALRACKLVYQLAPSCACSWLPGSGVNASARARCGRAALACGPGVPACPAVVLYEGGSTTPFFLLKFRRTMCLAGFFFARKVKLSGSIKEIRTSHALRACKLVYQLAPSCACSWLPGSGVNASARARCGRAALACGPGVPACPAVVLYEGGSTTPFFCQNFGKKITKTSVCALMGYAVTSKSSLHCAKRNFT